MQERVEAHERVDTHSSSTVRESLAGRIETIPLLLLSSSELLHRRTTCARCSARGFTIAQGARVQAHVIEPSHRPAEYVAERLHCAPANVRSNVQAGVARSREVARR